MSRPSPEIAHASERHGPAADAGIADIAERPAPVPTRARAGGGTVRQARELRVRGIVQGVGFRPFVWRIAHGLGLSGDVQNDASGVRIRVCGPSEALDEFSARLEREAPPLARIDAIDSRPLALPPMADTAPTADTSTAPTDGASTTTDTATTGVSTADVALLADGFHIRDSAPGPTQTRVGPDAATCPACRAESLDPFARRYRYPFTNCTHCGPRFSIIRAMPYDRAATTMAAFAMCADCAREYADPADRRFHAQPIACHACGPRAWLERMDGRAASFDQHSMLDDVDAAGSLIAKGEIVAVRGLGGFHLACDATNPEALARLRERKRRPVKPLALMARDLDVIARYARLDEAATTLLESPEAPIVLLETQGAAERLPEAVAPGMTTLGFMLPTTPLHHLMLRRLDRPVVMTSGNVSGRPQVTANDAARRELGAIADWGLFHDRDIANRIDDSVARIMAGVPRVLRLARGYAPASLPLPEGFDRAPPTLAFGGDLKAAFCLIGRGQAVLSQHQGDDLLDADTRADWERNLALYADLYDHCPALLACDGHPGYAATRHAEAEAQARGLPLARIGHHHAHVASCLAEHGVALETPPVLAIVLDGLGLGADGGLWGGEVLLADYRNAERLGHLKPVAMPGGEKAAREPWRNAWAHLDAAFGWDAVRRRWGQLAPIRNLDARPVATLARMCAEGVNSPRASSAGRLFDAAAALLGVAPSRLTYEGEAAQRLEALASRAEGAHRLMGFMAVMAHVREHPDAGRYSFSCIVPAEGASQGPAVLDPAPVWRAMLDDLAEGRAPAEIAWDFHLSLARALAELVARLAAEAPANARGARNRVVLSGGCFHNRILLEATTAHLEARGLTPLTHARIPAGDGGLALGQALIAAARALSGAPLSDARKPPEPRAQSPSAPPPEPIQSAPHDGEGG